jgi:hypothetical protein
MKLVKLARPLNKLATKREKIYEYKQRRNLRRQ